MSYLSDIMLLTLSPEVSAEEFKVWSYIALKNGKQFPQEELAELLHSSVRTVQRILKNLEQLNLIEVESSKGRGCHSTYNVVKDPDEWKIEKIRQNCTTQPCDEDKNTTNATYMNEENTTKSTSSDAYNIYINNISSNIQTDNNINIEKKENFVFKEKKDEEDLFIGANQLWAESTIKAHNISQALLKKAIRRAKAYCLSNDIEITDKAIKTYTYNELRLYPAEYKVQSKWEFKLRDGTRAYSWCEQVYTIPDDAPPRPAHDLRYFEGKWQPFPRDNSYD